MNEKKLLIFMPSIEKGGVEKNFFLISNYLSKNYKKVFVVTVSNFAKNKLDKNIKIIGPSSQIWQTKSRYPKYFICLIHLIFFLFQNKNTLVFAFQANLYAILIAKIFNKKIITRSNVSSTGWSKNIFKYFIYKNLLRLSDKVIVNSYDFKKELDKKFGLNCSVIYNPLNKSYIISESKKKILYSFFNGKILKLINIGRLVDQKDQITLIKSVMLLRKKFKLLIIGNGNNESKLKRFIINNKLSSKIKIIPFNKNPFKYLAQADICLLTSKFEGLPNVLLEAQCLKKYIISTNCPTGPKEILMNGKLGDLVKIGDYKSISKKIDNFDSKKKFYKKKINLGFKYLNRFDYKNNLNKYLKITNKFIYS